MIINTIYPATCCRRFNFLNLLQHVAATCCREQHAHTDDQQVAFNKLLATCFPKVVKKLQQATSCFQQVAFNMLQATCCLLQLLVNFWSTCCLQHIASNMLPA